MSEPISILSGRLTVRLEIRTLKVDWVKALIGSAARACLQVSLPVEVFLKNIILFLYKNIQINYNFINIICLSLKIY